jgi:hypothetical protein
MKKLILFITAFIIGFVMMSCGAKDDKNEVEPYSTTDTTKVETKHDPLRDSTNKSDPRSAEKGVE